MDYIIIIYIVFGLLPSLAWLSYYLRKDAHPEPKRMILKIFLWGALMTLPVFIIETGLAKVIDIVLAWLNFPQINCVQFCTTPYLDYLTGLSLNNLGGLSFIILLIYWFLTISFVEEFFKYLVIKIKVINSPHLDEPLDVMLYMVVAALGFAAVENVLYLFGLPGQMSFNKLIDSTLFVDCIRFVGAVFLHTLCSAVIGYCLAMSFYEVKLRKLWLVVGITIATVLHGLYDFSIMTIHGYYYIEGFIIPAVIILILAFFVFSGFTRLKNMKSICKIK